MREDETLSEATTRALPSMGERDLIYLVLRNRLQGDDLGMGLTSSLQPWPGAIVLVRPQPRPHRPRAPAIPDYTQLVHMIDYGRVLGMIQPGAASVGSLVQGSSNCFLNSTITTLMAATGAFDILLEPNILKPQAFESLGLPHKAMDRFDTEQEWNKIAQGFKLWSQIVQPLRGGRTVSIDQTAFFNDPAIQTLMGDYYEEKSYSITLCSALEPVPTQLHMTPPEHVTIPRTYVDLRPIAGKKYVYTWAGIVSPIDKADRCEDIINGHIRRADADDRSLTVDSIKRDLEQRQVSARIWLTRSDIRTYRRSKNNPYRPLTTHDRQQFLGVIETGALKDTSVASTDFLRSLPPYIHFHDVFIAHEGSERQGDSLDLVTLIFQQMLPIANSSAFELIKGYQVFQVNALHGGSLIIEMQKELNRLAGVPLAFVVSVIRSAGMEDARRREADIRPFAIPEKLTLREIVSPLLIPTLPNDILDKGYHLTGVGMTRGSSASCGHNAAVVRFPDGALWYVDPGLPSARKAKIPSLNAVPQLGMKPETRARFVVYESDAMLALRPPTSSPTGMNFIAP